ncbi:hypothetical protein [Kordia jejudonensis]|uniref:hypothetical protein n=1 Tax=Kordia jejudonensis TaxID=1348245 RepID=UPI00062949BD|nr:hypothetical protein [Kordia jejudonensis]
MSLLDIFSDSSTVVLILNAALYAKFIVSKDFAYKYFAIYLILMAINQTLVTISFELEIDNTLLANTYMIFQFVMLSLFYYAIFKEQKQRKYILIILLVVTIILGVQYAWTPKLFHEYNPYGIIATSTILIFYAITYFFHHISDKELKLYLVNSGILIYLLGTILLFSIAKAGLKIEPEIEVALWILNAFIYLVFQVIITTQWFSDRRKNKKI